MGDPAPFDKAASVFFDFLRRLEALFFDQAGEIVEGSFSRSSVEPVTPPSSRVG